MAKPKRHRLIFRLTHARAHTTDEHFTAVWSEAQTLTVDEAVTLALSISRDNRLV